MQASAMLQPVIVLALWTFVMWFLLYATRIPAIVKYKVKMDPNQPSSEMSAQLPANVRWKADNYNHLMEQPTVFYAVALSLALMDQGQVIAGQAVSECTVYLAWAYVASRIVHSVFQAFFNVIMVRFGIFIISSLILLALTVCAACRVFGL